MKNIFQPACPEESHIPSGASRPDQEPSPQLKSPLRISCPHLLRGWRFSLHAREVVDQRGFRPHAVIECCTAPDITATAYDRGPDRSRYVRGNLVVIANPATRTIITVLLRSAEPWDNHDARVANGVA